MAYTRLRYDRALLAAYPFDGYVFPEWSDTEVTLFVQFGFPIIGCSIHFTARYPMLGPKVVFSDPRAALWDCVHPVTLEWTHLTEEGAGLWPVTAIIVFIQSELIRCGVISLEWQPREPNAESEEDSEGSGSESEEEDDLPPLV